MSEIRHVVLGLFLSFILSLPVWAEEGGENVPKDHPTATLVRHSGEQAFAARLSKNLFRTEYREAWHEHSHTGDHHAGHDSSTWYEQYEDLESYYETEFYWDWETYYDYESYKEWVCYPNQPCQWVWKTRPVLKRRWVQKSRQVLKYRTVIRTRLRIFNESHPHQVPVQVYDRTVETQVTLYFPEGAYLNANETEKVEISFDGENVTVKPSSSFYIYREVERSGDLRGLVITLGLGTLDPDDYGKSSISGLRLEGEDEQAKLHFIDEKPFYRVKTTYHLQLIDETGRAVVDADVPLDEASEPLRTFAVLLVPGEGTLGRDVSQYIRGYIDYRIRLSVVRESPLFEGGKLEFLIEAKRKGVLDNSAFSSPSIPELRLYKEGGRFFLKILDTQAGHERVDTSYQIKIHRSTWLIGTHVVCRAHWKSDGTQEIVYLLEEGANNPAAKGLREAIESGTEYTVRLRVHRQSLLFTGGQVFFEIEKEMTP